MYHGERFNAYSHLAGFLLAVAALVLMLVKKDLTSLPSPTILPCVLLPKR